ncbi:unnamed protein product, partial [Ascophyllum nodosum]
MCIHGIQVSHGVHEQKILYVLLCKEGMCSTWYTSITWTEYGRYFNEFDKFIGQLAGRTGPVGSPDFGSASCDAYQTRQILQ